MASCLRWFVWLAIFLFVPRPAEARPAPLSFESVEAAKAGWDSQAPPAGGWHRVALPDDWSRRWPGHDGVVWYRLSWIQADATQPVGVAVDYWTLAGAAFLNGQPIARDAQLTEPLSRSWNRPRHWLLTAPALHEGRNTLLFRVSGYASYQPGLGPVTIGDPARVQAHYEAVRKMRRVLPLFNMGITAALAVFFFAIWLLRRSETSYGWYSLALLGWAGYSLNLVATRPWPFATSDGWARATLSMLILFAASYCMFVVRFLERRSPRIERLLWAIVACAIAAMWLVPHHLIGITRTMLAIASVALYFATAALLFAKTWRSPRVDYWVLNLTHGLMLIAGAHDLLVFVGLSRDNVYYSSVVSQILIVCMAVVLARKFVSAMRRVEHFNEQLSAEIAVARNELADMLNRAHALELERTKLEERMRLAHNLHDGMGATLVNNIAMLEHDGRAVSTPRFLSILKELREELRLVIDMSAGVRPAEQPLGGWLAPLRARLTLLCENRDIRCRWDLDDLDGFSLPAASSLDIIRIVREGLTNVIKHSGASEVEVAVKQGDAALRITIVDNGRGFEERTPGDRGIGLQSMASRAARLGGTFDIVSAPGRTALTVTIARPAEQ